MKPRIETLGTIDPNRLKGRDFLKLRLLQGATKTGVEKDRRKEDARRACRGRVREED